MSSGGDKRRKPKINMVKAKTKEEEKPRKSTKSKKQDKDENNQKKQIVTKTPAKKQSKTTDSKSKYENTKPSNPKVRDPKPKLQPQSKLPSTVPKPTTTKNRRVKPLGIVFDLDGTLIAEGWNIDRYVPRPGAIEFLKWCQSRGHALAVWTAAQPEWAIYVSRKICLCVKGSHTCLNGCTKTFDFIWCADKLRQRSKIPNTRDVEGCAWCLFYKKACTRCYCQPFLYNCPCRNTKDMHRIWYGKDPSTKRFERDRSLIVENNPQACIHNYGNAIYVPTYRGTNDENIFPRLQKLIEKLEVVDNVRKVSKCNHGSGPHACYEQAWLTD